MWSLLEAGPLLNSAIQMSTVMATYDGTICSCVGVVFLLVALAGAQSGRMKGDDLTSFSEHYWWNYSDCWGDTGLCLGFCCIEWSVGLTLCSQHHTNSHIINEREIIL